jgi:citrate lyase subunit beta/citryl-CoA lyase
VFRSLLFVPGDSQRKMERASQTEADALILDLEDAVAPSLKSAARDLVSRFLSTRQLEKFLIVRVNSLATNESLADLSAVVGHADGIMLPKCSGPDDLTRAIHYIEAFEVAAGARDKRTQIFPIVTETARSVLSLDAYQNCGDRLGALVWGAEDLATDLGSFEKRNASGYFGPYRLARDLCLMAAAAVKSIAIDTVYTDIKDLEGLAAEAGAAKRDGFRAKMAIHPSQVETINRAFSATPEERAWAAAIVDAFAANPNAGALRLNDQMIDTPHLDLARRILS